VKKLVDGINRFQKLVYDEKRQLFRELAGGQRPLALFITCSDSRIDPNLLTQTEPGDLFVLRNAGNIVPPYGAVDGGESATIEYAVSVLGVKNIVVCGHTHCGAMAGLLDDASTANLPAVRSWLKYAESTRRIVTASHPDDSATAARLMAAVETNVLVQIEHVKTHPAVRVALSEEEIVLHGWVYNFESGQVDCFDPATNAFRQLECDAINPSTDTGD
jgi:carbonic anhydrase